MLPADVFARFKRAQGHETLYICATDEHGTPTELAAAEAGIDVATFCLQQHEVQAELAAGFGLSWDHFGRSSSPQNREMTQTLAQQLWEGGFIEERVTQQVYSNADRRFLPDRYVIGTCPHCGYAAARGDQCENCTRVLDPADLLSPRSAVSGSEDIEIRPSKHLFLRQSLFAERLRAWIEGKKATWPLLVTSIALKWLDEGLQDRGITRDLEWGVPVNAAEWGANPDGLRPDVEGLKGKVFYVWFDAPIEYIGATREWADATGADWQRWWRGEAASDVTYVQFMGKDNVPFHTVGFPCTLIGVNERLGADGAWTPASNTPWKLVDRLKGLRVAVSLEGPGSLTIAAVAADRMDIGAVGSGILTLAGTVATLNATVRGAGTFDGAKLAVSDLKLTSESAGAVTLSVKRAANVNMSGTGTVTILGSPACTIKNVGSGTVSCGSDQPQR
jgi:methionyl-tRNA synthetase